MDTQSAIENFKRAKEIYLEEDGESADAIDLYDTTISALEELQQYRLTGLTPRMVEELKANDQRSHKLAVKRAAELDEYQAIGTVEECREAREKQVAVRARKSTVLEGREAEICAAKELPNPETYKCPKCGRSVVEHTCKSNLFPDGYIKKDYCDNCGQAIDWE